MVYYCPDQILNSSNSWEKESADFNLNIIQKELFEKKTHPNLKFKCIEEPAWVLVFHARAVK